MLRVLVILISVFFQSAGDCDFERGLCTWHNAITGDKFDWIQGSGGTLTVGTGPASDHTLGDKSGTTEFSTQTNVQLV